MGRYRNGYKNGRREGTQDREKSTKIKQKRRKRMEGVMHISLTG